MGAKALLELDPDEPRDEADRLLLRVTEAQPHGSADQRSRSR